MTANNANEIDRFKSEINLVEFAESFGYVKDKRNSGKHSVLMRSGDDKIVIATEAGHGVYFNVNDDSDNGSIIDFLQRRKGLNLGQVRKELRLWADPSPHNPRRKPVEQRPAKPVEISRDQAAVLRDYHHLWEYQIGYLERDRKLSPNTVKAFLDVIRTDDRRNTCFVHRDINGDVAGWEVKNKDFTGFSAGGNKSVCMHSPDGGAERLIVCESMIDAMSYHQLRGERGNVYISIGGGMSPEQKTHLESLFERFKAITIATDKDAAGDSYTAFVQGLRPDAKRDLPPKGKDWNDCLKLEVAAKASRSNDFDMQR